MSFTKDSRRVLAGGLNLLTSSDKIAEPGSLILENCRVDAQGMIRVRRGTTADATNLGGAIRSIMRVGSDRYAGVGTTLRRGGDLSTTVATGFDGREIHIVPFQGLTWAMNRGKQGKEVGSNFYDWRPAPPTEAPTAASGNEVSTAIRDFDSDETDWRGFLITDTLVPCVNVWNPDAATPDWTKLFSTVDKVQGSHSVHVECNPPGRYCLIPDNYQLAAPVDMTFSDVARDDDVIRFYFYASNPSLIESLFLILNCGSSSPRGTVTARIDPSILDQSAFSWTELRIARRLDPQSIASSDPAYKKILEEIEAARERGDTVLEESLLSQKDALYFQLIARRPYFEDALVGGVAFDWSDVTCIGFEWTCTDAMDVFVDGLSILGSADASLEGEFRYYISYDTAEGHESSLGPASNSIVVNKRQVALTNIQVSSDPQVTTKHIYREGGPLDRPLRVGSILNVATSWTDDVANDYAQSVNIEGQIDNDAPPAARGMLGPYQGQLVAWSTAAHPNRFFWTPEQEPWKWPGSQDDYEGNWQDIGSDNEEILYATEHGRQIWFYKERCVYKLVGELSNTPDRKASIGADGEFCVANAGSYDYVKAADGIYRFDGETARKITFAIEPIFHGETVPIAGQYVPPLNQSGRSNNVLRYARGLLYFSYCSGVATSPNVTLVYQEAQERWVSLRLAAATGSTAFSSIYDEGTIGALLAGTPDGDLLQLETTDHTDQGSPITMVWQSGDWDMGYPDNIKVCADLVVDYEIGGSGAFTVNFGVDGGALVALGSLTSSGRDRAILQLNSGDGLDAVRAAVRIEGNVTTDARIYGVWIHFYLTERRAKTFDTGPIELAPGVVAQVDRLEASITGLGTTTWKVQSDLPGRVLTQRATSNFGATGGRKVETTKLASMLEGRWWRILYQCAATTFQMHQLRVRVRRLGLYLEAGLPWESPVMAPFGLETVWHCREMEIDADTDDTLTVSVQTDLPGQAMTERTSRTFNTEVTTTGRRPTNLRFPSTVLGQQMRLTLTAAGVARIYGIRLHGHPWGSQSAWKWFSVPLPASDEDFSWVNLPVDRMVQG